MKGLALVEHSKPVPHVEVCNVPEPAWLELYRCLPGRRNLLLSIVQSSGEAKEWVQRFTPDCRFRLVLRSQGAPFLIFSLRPSFTGEPVQRVVYASVLDKPE
jgi:hypothetical protein